MKNFVIILSALLLIGCSEEPRFYDVQALNQDIKKHVGVDLFDFKEKTDSMFSKDPNFYMDMLEDMAGGFNNKCFERAGLPIDLIDNKGVHLNRIAAKDSIARLMMLSFSENILKPQCVETKTDSICYYRNQWRRDMKKYDPRELAFGYSFLQPSLYEIYSRDFLTQEEFHYLIIFTHYLSVLVATDIDTDD